MRNIATGACFKKSHARDLSLTVATILAASAAVAQDSEHAVSPAEEVVVLGRGETRQVQSISSMQIDALPAGTSPLKAIEKIRLGGLERLGVRR